jgi:NAD(P)H-flavin reductase/ferredoxin
MGQGNFRVAIEDSNLSFEVKNNETIVRAASRQGIVFPSLCNVGECGSCRCKVREGRIKLKKDISHHVPIDRLKAGDILGCQSLIQSDVILNVPTLSASTIAELDPIKSTAHVMSAEKLNHDIIELSLELDSSITYRPGQYAHLTVPTVVPLSASPRSYSFASGTNNRSTTRVQFHIRKVNGGAFTEWLFSANRVGEKIELNGPFGDFGWRAATKKPLFIAGGSGFSPIKALLEQCIEEGRNLEAVLIYGARTRKDVYCLSQIGSLQKRWPGSLVFLPILSDEPVESDWPGARGLVHESLSSQVVDAAGREAYMCGPPPMIDACLAELSGVTDSNNIHYDKFLDRSHMENLAAD